jgi:hypothetical protein
MGCVEQSVGCDDAPGGPTGGWGTGGVSYRRLEPSSGRSPDQNHPLRLHHPLQSYDHLRLHYRLDQNYRFTWNQLLSA